MGHILFDTSEIVLFPILIFLFATANILGAFVGRKDRNISETTPAALLGLLALLLGFSFSMVIARFDLRRDLVLKESNAIGTAFLRAGAIQDPASSTIKKTLREYVDARLEFYAAGADLPRIYKALDRATALQKRFWSTAEAEAKKGPTAISGLMLSSLNEVIDLDAARVDALRNHLPEALFYLLIAISTCALFTLGTIEGWKGRHPLPWKLLLPILVATVLTTLVDIDRPRRGVIKASQDSMIALKKELDAN